MNADEIDHLRKLMEAHGIAMLEVEEGNLSIRLDAGCVVPQHDAMTPSEKSVMTYQAVLATSFGHVRFREPGDPDAPVFPRPVRKGDWIALLDAGGLVRAVVAPADGLLPAPKVEDGSLVGYGTRLF